MGRGGATLRCEQTVQRTERVAGNRQLQQEQNKRATDEAPRMRQTAVLVSHWRVCSAQTHETSRPLPIEWSRLMPDI